jgi:hypothetical protein
MLRMMICTVFALTASTGAAFAQPKAQRSVTIQSPLGQEVRADDGTTVLGRVSHVSRDHRGRIVAVEIPGLAPADAPRAPVNAIAENDLRLNSATTRGGGIFESGEHETR